MDGTIDVDVQSNKNNSQWNLTNLEIQEAEFLHEELGRAIARQRERGFPKPEPAAEPAKLPAPEATVIPSS